MKYLDLTGLGEVWANIKSYISSKIPTKTSQLQNDSNYVTTSQLPSKTSQLTNDSDFTTNAKLTSKANDSDVVHKSGNETINGVKTFTSEIVNTSQHFRHICGKYGTIWRQDGYDLYLLITNRGDQYGSWNNFRPLKVNLATGICNINGTAGGVAWSNVSDRPTKVSQFTNDSGYLTSINGVTADNNGNVNIQGVSNGIEEIIQGYYVPNGIVEKSGSVYFGTLAQPQAGATLSDFRDINITITDEFYPEAGKIYDYSQIFSTLYLHSYGSDSAAGSTFDCGINPEVDKWFGGWIKVAGSNLVRNSGKYLCTSVSPYGYAVTLRYNLTMTCETHSYPMYECKIVSKTVPQNQMTVTSKATFMRVG